MLLRAIRVVILSTVLFSQSAYGADWSVGVGGGLAVPTQNYFPTNTGDAGVHSYPYFNALEASEGWMLSIYGLHRIWKWADAGLTLSYDTTGASANAPVDPSQYALWPKSQTPGPVKTDLGKIETWAILPTLRVHHWDFGGWTPFLDIEGGYGWNQWSVPLESRIPGPFSAAISPAVVVRGSLGVDYSIDQHTAVEWEIGFSQSDPLGSVQLPNSQGGMDQEFNLSFFYTTLGLHFSF